MLKVYLNIVYRNISHRPLRTILAALTLAVAVALTLFVMMLGKGMTNGIAAAVEPFDMIVGAKGSPNQLVLNTVFLQDAPIGNIPHDFLEKFENDKLVAEVVPMGFGDNYMGYRIAGTTGAIFRHSAKKGGEPWLSVVAGRQFESGREAVLGSSAAAGTGLKVGDTFHTSHGHIAGLDEHENGAFTVVGILDKLNSPYDAAVLVPVESLWDIHAHGDDDGGDFTALLIKPEGYGEALKLYSKYMNDRDIQLIFPSQVVSILFALLGDGGKILTVAGYAVFGASVIIIGLLLYSAALGRARGSALLRVTGAERRDILTCVFMEGAVVTISGICAGTMMAFAVMAAIGNILEGKVYVYISGIFGTPEVLAICAFAAVCLSASIIPAYAASQREIAKDV